MENPLYFRELPLTAPFCNRNDELKEGAKEQELFSHAKNKANVYLLSKALWQDIAYKKSSGKAK